MVLSAFSRGVLNFDWFLAASVGASKGLGGTPLGRARGNALRSGAQPNDWPSGRGIVVPEFDPNAALRK